MRDFLPLAKLILDQWLEAYPGTKMGEYARMSLEFRIADALAGEANQSPLA